MMRVPTLLLVILLACITLSLAANAQTDLVRGRIRIIPPVDDPIDVIIQLYSRDNQLVDEIPVDQNMPYRFKGVGSSNVKLTIRVVVNSPQGYLSSRTEYTKQACCNFDGDIFLKHPADIYIDNMRLASQAPTFNTAIAALSASEMHAVTVSQQLEVKRQMGALYAKQGDYESQQKVLASFYKTNSPQDLSLTKKQVYWAERLDGFLNWMDYTKLRMPEQDFGQLLVQESNKDRLSAWKEFINDFKVAYPDVEFDPATETGVEITNQLQAINKIIRPELDTVEGEGTVGH